MFKVTLSADEQNACLTVAQAENVVHRLYEGNLEQKRSMRLGKEMTDAAGYNVAVKRFGVGRERVIGNALKTSSSL